MLPTGYAGMIVLAVIPPIWRRIMDPRVLAHFDGDISRANIQPSKREKVLAAYPPPADEHEASASADLTPGAVEEVMAARCPKCDYVYHVEAGEEREGFAAGTAWSEIPDDWCCPDCGVRDKLDFVPLEKAEAA